MVEPIHLGLRCVLPIDSTRRLSWLMNLPREAKTQDACNRRKNDMDEQTQLKDSILAQAHEKRA